MNKSGKIIIGTLVGATVLGGVGFGLYKGLPNKKDDSNIHVGVDDIISDSDKTSEEYIALIRQYSKQIDSLNSQIASNKVEYELKMAEMNAEIVNLQEELKTISAEKTEQIAEKNDRIASLQQAVQLLAKENEDTVADCTAKISSMQALLSTYETKVIRSISLPVGFTFNTLGFNVIEGNDFLFWASGNNSKLYYYHYDTNTTETINVVSTGFSNFYKYENKLYFRTGDHLYVHDLTTKRTEMLGLVSTTLNYVSDGTKMYFFDVGGGYAIHDYTKDSFVNNLLSLSGNYGFSTIRADRYILHYVFKSPGTASNACYLNLFDTQTGEDKHAYSNNLSVALSSFVKTSHGYYACFDKGFYKLNIEDMTFTLIQDLASVESRSFVFGNKVVIFGNNGNVYSYDGTTMTNMASWAGKKFGLHFIPLSSSVYYVMDSNSSVNGLWKLDLNANTFTLVSDKFNGYQDGVSVGHYEVVMCYQGKSSPTGGFYIIDRENGSVDSLSTTGYFNGRIRMIETDNYVVFTNVCSSNSSSTSCYLYYYDKQTDQYGQVSSSCFSNAEFDVRGDLLYVKCTNHLYVYNLVYSKTSPITDLSIDSNISSMKAGVFYSKAGTVGDGTLYIKYVLRDDGTFDKELVII